MWGIWSFETNDWVRELPSKVDDGEIALLAFEKKRDAYQRAAKHYGYDYYTKARTDGWCEVRALYTAPPIKAKARAEVHDSTF